MLFCATSVTSVASSEAGEVSGGVIGARAGSGEGGAIGPDEAMAGAIPLCGTLVPATMESDLDGIPSLASAVCLFTGDVFFTLEAWSA